jgi:small GTP-binding protein
MQERRRVVFCGDPGVGKTSIISKYQGVQSATLPTVVCDESKLPVKTSEGKVVSVSVWDTAGNIDLTGLMPHFVRNAAVCVLVFGIDDGTSLAHVADWREKVQSIVGDSLPFIIAANKIDLRVGEAPGFDEMGWGCPIYETSALTRYGLQQLFTAVADTCVGKKSQPIQGVIQIGPVPQNQCLSCGR